MTGQVYLLAGGEGRRAGGPKAWLEFEGKPLLQRQIEFLGRRFALDEVAVSMQLSWTDRCREISEEVCWVPEDPRQPMLGAVKALLRSMPPRDWAYLYHVDMPVWDDALFDALDAAVETARAAGQEAVIPEFDGRGGHPVALAPALAERILALDPARDRLDRFLRSCKLRRFAVEQSCVLENWNEGVARG